MKKCSHCSDRSIPGLVSPLCQYHYDVAQFGKDWADKCRADREPKDAVNPLIALVEQLTVAQRKRDAEKWCFQSAAAVFSAKPYDKNRRDLEACAGRLLVATATMDAIQDKIDAIHAKEKPCSTSSHS
jgi:hypothetical protein